MAVAYKKWGNPEEIEKGGVRGLMALYVKFHDEAKKDPALDDEARNAFTRMENGDEEVLSLWRKFVSQKDVISRDLSMDFTVSERVNIH
jgi:arginyl-tRNA synthetase